MQSTSRNMQRKPGFPVANCSIKMPDGLNITESSVYEEDNEQQHRRQQLINFGHSQWGFNSWSWAVTKQELDFVELVNGKYSAGVVAFVSVRLKSFDIHRENIGYATSNANTKGLVIYKSRKCAVTNALRETLLSFGGSVATELMELLQQTEVPTPAPTPCLPPTVPPEPLTENNQNIANKIEPKNAINNIRKDETVPQNMKTHHPVKNTVTPAANASRSPPVTRAHPMPCPLPATTRPPAANRLPAPLAPAALPPPPLPPAPRQPRHHPRPNSNDCKLEGMTEEEARAERKRRQRLAQEEFRQKQLVKNETDEKQDLSKNSSSFDELLMEIPTQGIVLQETGESGARRANKRRSPVTEGSDKRRARVS